MSRSLVALLFVGVLALTFGTTTVAAFGAGEVLHSCSIDVVAYYNHLGNIPSFAYLEGKVSSTLHLSMN
jgi:hypothetical protein